MELIITSIVALSSIVIGLLVLFNDKKSFTNILFFIFSFSLALWAIANYFSLQEMEKPEILFWMRTVMAIAVVQGISFYLFIHNFPKSKIVLKKKYLFSLLVLGGLTIIISFTPFLFSDVSLENGDRSPVVAPGMVLFLITAVGSIVAGFILMIIGLRKYVF